VESGITGEELTFSVNATNADDYLWNFGDSSEIGGVTNPDYTYYEPGTYTVLVTCTNTFGCSDTSSVTVVIAQGTGIKHIADEVRIYAYSKQLNILFSEPPVSCQTDVYSMEGKKLWTGGLNSNRFTINLEHLPAGVYVVALRSRELYFSRQFLLTN
jgi:PKD repeat protein